MKLLTKAIRAKFKTVGSQQGVKDPLVIAKFFDPCGNWTWYATEFDGDDTFFGVVQGLCRDMGYFSLSEIEKLHRPMGLTIERDRYCGYKTLSEHEKQ